MYIQYCVKANSIELTELDARGWNKQIMEYLLNTGFKQNTQLCRETLISNNIEASYMLYLISIIYVIYYISTNFSFFIHPHCPFHVYHRVP